MTKSIEDILAEATPPERIVPICTRGDLLGEYQHLERQLAGASKEPPNLGTKSEARVISEQMAEMQPRITDAVVNFRMCAIPQRRWSDLWVKQPEPSTEDMDDEAQAERKVDWEAWACELIAASCHAPEMTASHALQLAGKVGNGQLMALYNAALELSMVNQKIPFTVAASENSPNSGPK